MVGQLARLALRTIMIPEAGWSPNVVAVLRDETGFCNPGVRRSDRSRRSAQFAAARWIVRIATATIKDRRIIAWRGLTQGMRRRGADTLITDVHGTIAPQASSAKRANRPVSHEGALCSDRWFNHPTERNKNAVAHIRCLHPQKLPHRDVILIVDNMHYRLIAIHDRP